MEAFKVKTIAKATAAEYAKRLVGKHFSSAVSSVVYVGGGSYGMAYKVSQNASPEAVIVKIFTASKLCYSESLSLKSMREHTRVEIPEVYFTHYADADVPADCICMQHIEGKDAFTSFNLLLKPKKQKRAFAQAVVDGLLELHRYTNDKFGFIENANCETWLDFYAPFALDVLETARRLNKEGTLEGYILDAMEAAYSKFGDIFSEPVTEACFVHGDLNVMNIMVKPPFELSGFIDPLESKFADREYDLFQFNNLTGRFFGLYDLYKAKYPVSRNCDIKCAFYGLWNEVYSFIKSGKLFKMIMNPLVKNMRKQLEVFNGGKN